MLTVQIVGGVVLTVGLVLFAASQWTGGKRGTPEAGLKAWSINVSGPPGLILIVVGIMVFLYPLSPWWPSDAPPATLPPIVVPTTTTTTTGFYELAAPYDLWFDGRCVYWTPGDDSYEAWEVDIGVTEPDGFYTYTDNSLLVDWWELDESGRGYPYWCFWDDWNPAFTYDLWVWAVADGTYSSPAWISP